LSACPQRGGHRDLTIREFAQRAAILSRHADGMRALLRETRFVEDENPTALGQDGTQTTPDGIGVPGSVRDEMLQRLVEARLVTRASIADIDLRGLSLSNPSTYCRSDTRCARWPKQSLN
jgi:hypothetical protein